MAGFKALKDVSIDFDAYLHQLSDNLYCAQIGQTPEDIIAKKLQNLKIISSKYRLLHAKQTATTPQIEERVRNGVNVMSEYEEAIQKRVLEETTVKAVSRNHAIKALLTTPDSKLRPDMLCKKQKLKMRLQRLATLDNELTYHESRLNEKQREHDELREQWDTVLGQLRDKRSSAAPETQSVELGSDYEKISKAVSVLENIRLMMGPLLVGRTRYDWQNDPNNFLQLFRSTREPNTEECFLKGDC